MAEETTKPKTKKAAKAKLTEKPTEVEEKNVGKAVLEAEESKVEEPEKETKNLAKAGKRSAKAIEETKVKEEKEARKKATDSEPASEKPKPTVKPTRPKAERKGKKYQEAYKSIDKTKSYPLAEGLALVSKTSTSKFDATVELHVRLGVDPRQADQNIRDNIVLPSGSGKTIRIAVFAEDKDLEAAKKAGADIALNDEFLQQLDKNVINFDLLISSPSVMVKLSKYARLLGPKGLMPNPKNGTVTNDPAKAVKEAKAGKVEYKIDSTGIVHLGIGKVSFGEAKLAANAEAVMASIKANKPSSLKGNYIVSVFLSTTMGPSVQIDKNF